MYRISSGYDALLRRELIGQYKQHIDLKLFKQEASPDDVPSLELSSEHLPYFTVNLQTMCLIFRVIQFSCHSSSHKQQVQNGSNGTAPRCFVVLFPHLGGVFHLKKIEDEK
jgi:hypothetical protein